MPPKSRRTRRPEQCVYKEGGRRCVRNGSGNPALCTPHRIAFEEHARKADRRSQVAQQPRSTFANMVGDFINGRPLGDVVARAINDFDWAMGGGYGSFSPDIDTGEPQQQGRTRVDPSEFRPPPRWHREPPPPPPPARPAVELIRARQSLGFGPADQITEDMIKERRRQLARKHHPDRGGSLERMKVINDACDTLLASL